MIQLRTVLRIGLVLGSLGLLCGCSNFDREWNQAANVRNGIDGRWQGQWKSEQDGHSGALQCVLKQTGPQNYNAYFNATYAGIFHFSYDAKLTGQPVDGQVHLVGQQDLGWPVGVYHYDGTANDEQFYCAYRSKDDHGYFALSRAGGAAPTAPLNSQKQ